MTLLRCNTPVVRRSMIALRRNILVLLLVLSGCSGRSATADDCRAILDRIVEIELGEQGYRDAALAKRKQAELRRTLARDLARCEGRRIPEGAIECLQSATSAEAVSHRCLR